MPITEAAALLGGAALGGLFGSGNSALGSLMSYQSAKKLQQHQYDLNQKSLRESPKNARLGWTSAGFNPLLALGSQGMGFSASSSGVGYDSSGMSSGANSAVGAMQAKATIDNVNADTGLKGEQAETEKARRISMEFDNAMKDVETHLKQKDLSTYDRRFYSNLYEQMQRAENYKANSAVARMNANTNAINAETNKINAETNKNRKSFSGLGFSYSGTFGSNSARSSVEKRKSVNRSNSYYWDKMQTDSYGR